MEVVGRGRDADVMADAPGTVRRHYRDGRSAEAEAAVMVHARDRGFPVPRVVDCSGPDIVMERVDGRTMLAELVRTPWRLQSHARTLAMLHRQLHDIVAPAHAPAAPGTPGDRLLHLDLHPENVLLSPAGPVVIDWANAARGTPAVDVAQCWVIMASSVIPGRRTIQSRVANQGRDLFITRFRSHFDAAEVARELPAVVQARLGDPNLLAEEAAVLRRLLAAA